MESVTREERQLAKAVNFGLIFGMSLTGFRNYAESGYGIKLSLNESKEIYDNFFQCYSGIAKWHQHVKVCQHILILKNIYRIQSLLW